jgi:hypothetical protein
MRQEGEEGVAVYQIFYLCIYIFYMRLLRHPKFSHINLILYMPWIDFHARACRKKGHFVCLSEYPDKEITNLQSR